MVNVKLQQKLKKKRMSFDMVGSFALPAHCIVIIAFALFWSREKNNMYLCILALCWFNAQLFQYFFFHSFLLHSYFISWELNNNNEKKNASNLLTIENWLSERFEFDLNTAMFLARLARQNKSLTTLFCQ